MVQFPSTYQGIVKLSTKCYLLKFKVTEKVVRNDTSLKEVNLAVSGSGFNSRRSLLSFIVSVQVSLLISVKVNFSKAKNNKMEKECRIFFNFFQKNQTLFPPSSFAENSSVPKVLIRSLMTRNTLAKKS